MVYSMLCLLRMIKAAGKLHARMLTNILRLPMSFFDTTPIGRIVNRFSNDVDTIDNDLPWMVQNFFEGAFIILSTLLVISYSTPIFLSVILPIGFIYFLIQVFMPSFTGMSVVKVIRNLCCTFVMYSFEIIM